MGLASSWKKKYFLVLLHHEAAGETMEEINVSSGQNGNSGVAKERFIYPNLKLRVYTTGMRQNRLAKMVGIDEAYLSRIINGVRVPGKQMQSQIAQALGCDPDWLFQQATIQAPADPNYDATKLSSLS